MLTIKSHREVARVRYLEGENPFLLMKNTRVVELAVAFEHYVLLDFEDVSQEIRSHFEFIFSFPRRIELRGVSYVDNNVL